MSRKVISIKNFKLGLDRRRAEISSVPGALFIGSDGHINTGGEFEKRKAFVVYADVAVLDTDGFQGTFGLKRTTAGLNVFGSALPFTDKVTTHRATTTNVATLTLGTGHGFVAGDFIDVVGMTGYTVSNVAVASVTTTTISYPNVHANEGTTADVTGTVRQHQFFSQVRLVEAMPTGIVYQQLKHPAVLDEVAYDNTKYRMTKVVYATTFDNLIWVIAEFADGGQFAYYDRALVQDFVAGYILPYQAGNNVLIAKHLTRLVNETESYTAVQSANPNDNQFLITGPFGNEYDVTKDVVTVGNGDVTFPATPTTPMVPGVIAQSAVAQFRIMAGTASAGTNKITNVKVNGVEILAAAVDWVTDMKTTAAAVAAQIGSGFTATSLLDSVTIKTVTPGATANGHVVEVTTAGNVCIGDWRFGLTSITDVTPTSVDSVTLDGVDILGGVVAYTTSFSNTASLVVTAINAGTGTHGYLACAYGASVRVSKKVTSSANPPMAAFVNTTGIGVGPGEDPPVSIIPIAIASRVPSDSGHRSGTVTVIGGYPPYLYDWVSTLGYHAEAATIYSPNPTFIMPDGLAATYYPSIYCVVKDSHGQTTQSNTINLLPALTT